MAGVSKAWIMAAAMGCMALPACAAAQRKTYVDRQDGVSFSYPAGWLLNGDDDAATAKLRITNEAQPVAVVQLEGNFSDEGPYKGTDFEAGAFAYVVKQNESEQRCLATLDHNTDKIHTPEATSWNGVPAKKLEASFAIEGTQDHHQIVAVYRGQKCYLFETVIVSRTPGEVSRPLAAARWDRLREQFASVLRSVRFLPGRS